MALKLGKQKSNGELLEGREKLSKDFVCENPVKLESVLVGNNPEDGTEFMTALVTTLDNRECYVGIPVTSMDVFTFGQEELDQLQKEDIYLFMEKKRNRKNTRDYYIAWMDRK